MRKGLPASALRDLLDGGIRGKEVASQHFVWLASCVEDVHVRRALRRLAQEEWDHRKILVKHRRGLFGRTDAGRGDALCPAAYHPMIARPVVSGPADLLETLHRAVRCERLAHAFFMEASHRFDERAVKVFLRILAEEGLAQVVHLRDLIHELERAPAVSLRRPGARGIRAAM